MEVPKLGVRYQADVNVDGKPLVLTAEFTKQGWRAKVSAPFYKLAHSGDQAKDFAEQFVRNDSRGRTARVQWQEVKD